MHERRAAGQLGRGRLTVDADDASQLRLYLTADHRCGYLPLLQARNLVVDPGQTDGRLYGRLIALGFRRSGDYLYRPYCEHCDACLSLRVPSGARFRPDRSQRRCLRGNADLYVHWGPAGYRDEHFALFARYVNTRHPGGGMDDPTPDGYRQFLLSGWNEGLLGEVRRRDDGTLLAVAVVDRLGDGLSAVYSFFDPQQDRRGLGTYCVLQLLVEAARLGLPWVYLGYWIAGCDKMAYKARFRPHQVFRHGRWRWDE